MQIFSVTEHINSLNTAIDRQVEFINNVERMRRLQILRTKDEPHLKMGSGMLQLQGELREAEKLVDDFLAKRNKGGSNDVPC